MFLALPGFHSRLELVWILSVRCMELKPRVSCQMRNMLYTVIDL